VVTTILFLEEGAAQTQALRPMYGDCMLPYELQPNDLAQLLQKENAAASPDQACLLLDVREPWEMEAAPFPGSVAMPMGDVPSRAHAELDPDRHIIAICHHGVRSLSVTAWLRREGFEQSQSLAGGTDGWSREIDPSLPRY
jgi:rhodanese-related sulfurtransferase